MTARPSPANQAPTSATKYCVLYLKGAREHRTPWFSRRGNVQRALEIMRRRYGQNSAIIWVD
jgi:hypothetical protein